MYPYDNKQIKDESVDIKKRRKYQKKIMYVS